MLQLIARLGLNTRGFMQNRAASESAAAKFARRLPAIIGESAATAVSTVSGGGNLYRRDFPW